MIGTSVEVGLQVRGDVVCSAVSEERVDEAIASRLGYVGIGETQAFPTVDVIAQTEVDAEGSARRGARLLGVGGQHNRLLGGDEHVRPQQLPRLSRVLRRRQVRMRARRAVSGQLQHFRSQRGDDATPDRHPVLIE